MTQIAIGPQCAGCRLVRIGQDDLDEPNGWLCAPFPEGIPRPYDRGNQDCPYRQSYPEGDPYTPSGVKGRIKSKVLRAHGEHQA